MRPSAGRKDGRKPQLKKDVMITIRSHQSLSGQESETVELVTAGRLTSHGPDGWLLSYEESEMTGMEGTRSTFRIEPGRVSLIRTGQINSQMVFELGRTHTSLYNTPYGSMEIGLTAKRIDNTISSEGGHLNIEYAIDLDHLVTGYYRFEVSVKENKAQQAVQPAERRHSKPAGGSEAEYRP